MKRLTPKKVLAAYKKTGLAPCREMDTREDSYGVTRDGCPAFVVAYANGLEDYHCFDEDEYPETYVMGFIQAIDGGGLEDACVEKAQKKTLNTGYQDGLKVREAIWPSKKTKKKAK